MIEVLRKAVEDSSLVNKTLTGGSGKEQKSYQVKSTDDFSYTDPIDGSLTSKQVVLQRLFLSQSEAENSNASLTCSEKERLCHQYPGWFIMWT